MLAAILFFPLLAQGLTVRLDDSASPRSRVAPQITLSNEGRPLSESLDPRTATVRYGRVEYRLATSQYAGRQGRIYLVVAAAVPGLRTPAGMRLTWPAGGLFASGAARPGERRLVWTGTVPGPWMQESLDLTMELDLAFIQLPGQGSTGFDTYFELEVSP